MHHPYHWTRLLLAGTLFLVASGVYFALQLGSGRSQNSLLDFLRGSTPAPAVSSPIVELSPLSEPLMELGDVPLLARLNEEYTHLMQTVVPSVVSVSTTKIVNVKKVYWGVTGLSSRNERYRQPGLGSGFIVSREGHIITNHHVVAGVDDIIQVTRGDGKVYPAELLGSDPAVDIAILKITGKKGEHFPALPLGDSDKVQVGEMVFAIGNPFGLNESVTRGIISAKERRLTDGDTAFFQTDAVINQGSSGGPLINLRGEVIGITVSIFTGQQGALGWQGIGLAIPSNDVRHSLESIMARGEPGEGFLGITPTDLMPHIAISAGLPSNTRGVVVTEVMEGKPAEKAGLQAEDILLAIDGQPISGTSDYISRLRGKTVGEEVLLGVRRDGQDLELTAVAGRRSSEVAIAADQRISDLLGVNVRSLTPIDKQMHGVHPASPAIEIVSVHPKSPAAHSLRAGDLVHDINRQPIDSEEQFIETINAIPTNGKSILRITRNRQPALVVLKTHTGAPRPE